MQTESLMVVAPIVSVAVLPDTTRDATPACGHVGATAVVAVTWYSGTKIPFVAGGVQTMKSIAVAYPPEFTGMPLAT